MALDMFKPCRGFLLSGLNFGFIINILGQLGIQGHQVISHQPSLGIPDIRLHSLCTPGDFGLPPQGR